MIEWNDIINIANQGNPEPDKRVERTEEEWGRVLSPEQFRITRLKGTESKFSGELCSAHDAGIYGCICCDTDLFDSTIKYESNSGWPSFTEAIKDNAIKYILDETHGMQRVEVQCNTCDAHLGHVFPDGPAPSGLRYCVNSLSLNKK